VYSITKTKTFITLWYTPLQETDNKIHNT
jgi:hypothetical protein